MSAIQFAAKLAELRAAAGLTQLALADKSGVAVGSIRDLEQGRREPTLSTAAALATALGVKLDAFQSPPSRKVKPAKRGRPKKGK